VRVNRTTRARRTLLVFVASFAASSATLAVAAEAYPRVRDPVSGDKISRLAGRVAAAPDRRVVLFIGSSRTGFAFHALRAEGRLPNALCFNLGLPAAGPICELVTLNRALAAGIKPALVLVEILPPMLQTLPAGPREEVFLTGDRLSAAEVRTVVRFGYSSDDVALQWAKSRLAPWWCYRFPIWGRIAPSWLSYLVRGDWGRSTDAGGWNASIRDAVTSEERQLGEDETRAEYAATLKVLTPGGGAVDAVREIQATCRRRGIALRFVLLPESRMFRSLYGPGVEIRLQTFLSGLDTPTIDARRWQPDEAFLDGHHLMRPGAASFTDRLTVEVIDPVLEPLGRPRD
jgi:hypothetical protein